MTGPLETDRKEKVVSITRAPNKQTQINKNEKWKRNHQNYQKRGQDNMKMSPTNDALVSEKLSLVNEHLLSLGHQDDIQIPLIYLISVWFNRDTKVYSAFNQCYLHSPRNRKSVHLIEAVNACTDHRCRALFFFFKPCLSEWHNCWKGLNTDDWMIYLYKCHSFSVHFHFRPEMTIHHTFTTTYESACH